MDERTIIRRCQEGDSGTFRMVVEGHRQAIFALAFRMLCDESAAKDVVQETFIRAWQGIGRFDTGRPLRVWLRAIAVHLCQDAIERGWRTGPIADDALAGLVSDQRPDRRMENEEMGAVIRSLTKGLSAKQRVVFTLVCLEGLETGEVASLTGLSGDQIKSNLYHARRAIKDQLKRMGYE